MRRVVKSLIELIVQKSILKIKYATFFPTPINRVEKEKNKLWLRLKKKEEVNWKERWNVELNIKY